MSELTKSELYNVCDDIDMSDNILLILENMWATMYTGRGIGLAANQIGIRKRVIVIDTGQGFKQEFINPVITRFYGGKHTAKEGCLSFPGQTALISRSKQIVIEGLDQNMMPIKRKLKGMAARAVQHEVDHLNGITCIK